MNLRWATPIVIGALLLVGCGGGAGTDSTSALTVYGDEAAAPLFRNLVAAFESANPDAEVTLVLGEPADLVDQIQSSDGAAVLMSASAADVESLDSEATAFAADPLQIAVTFGNPKGITGLEDFADSGLAIGLCSSETTCGSAAEVALTLAGVTASVDVTGDDIWTLLADVESGDLDATIASSSEVYEELGYVDGILIPDEYQAAAEYEIVAASSDTGIAETFVSFVLSDEGIGIIEAHGMVAQ